MFLKIIVKLLFSFILVFSIGFSVAIDTTQAAEQQWVEISSKSTTDLNKPWTITFSKDVDKSSVNLSTLYVVDSKGLILEVNTPVVNGNQIVVTPKHSYIAGETYTLYLKNIKSSSGETLKDTKFNFTVLETNNAPKLVKEIPNQSTTVGENLTINLGDYFVDTDKGDTLTYTATKGQITGNSWVYEATKEVVESVTITATDKAGKNVKSIFTISVKAVPTQNTLYDTIYNALVNIQPEVDVSQFTTDSALVFDILEKVLDDHPEIYYFQHKGSLFWSNGRFELKYRYSESEILSMNSQLEQVSNKIISQNITAGMSDFEKVKAIHDYVVLNAAYDYNNYLNGTVPTSSYHIDGLLLKGIAVCDGYAKSMVYLLNKVGIPVLYVTGEAGGDLHAWNKVQIDGTWYSLDATWDDPVPNKEGQVRYEYFLVPDSVLSVDHSWDDSEFPDATDSRYLFMADMWAFELYEGQYYYSSIADDINIYKISLDGKGKQKISNERANELVVYDGWIYFSNYSKGGYLYKMKTDGTQLTKLNDFIISNLQRNASTLTYTNKQGKKYTYEIE
ncbi:DUF5050 domain-containing protein [Lysinibacillus endophyticus]|uniref:DUF5050 domain-containing protein n=1 Tax=Ureibacillus endophyticus TaxID=1978490 RepID=UPI0020A02BFC|nr:DUF5050 domain-containing protein [Lysinibacillus endophyticus]MCP1143693.1 DUF5050 domain-containing protein [Lysinibacillus endophyticus]